jgi:hypothetical protein
MIISVDKQKLPQKDQVDALAEAVDKLKAAYK